MYGFQLPCVVSRFYRRDIRLVGKPSEYGTPSRMVRSVSKWIVRVFFCSWKTNIVTVGEERGVGVLELGFNSPQE